LAGTRLQGNLDKVTGGWFKRGGNHWFMKLVSDQETTLGSSRKVHLTGAQFLALYGPGSSSKSSPVNTRHGFAPNVHLVVC